MKLLIAGFMVIACVNCFAAEGQDTGPANQNFFVNKHMDLRSGIIKSDNTTSPTRKDNFSKMQLSLD